MLQKISLIIEEQNRKKNNFGINNTVNSAYLSFLYQSNQKGKVPIFRKENKPKDNKLRLESPSSFTEMKSIHGSLSTKDTFNDKETIMTQKAKSLTKNLKNFDTFYTSMKSIQQQYSHKLKANIEEKNIQSKHILEKVKKITNHVNKWNSELEKNKEYNNDIVLSSFQLDIHLKRLQLENDINSTEITELKWCIEKMQNDINSLNRVAVEYVNKSLKYKNSIEEMKRKIRQLPQDSNIIENQIRNVKSAISMLNKKQNEIQISLNNHNNHMRDYNKDMDHITRIYETAIK